MYAQGQKTVTTFNAFTSYWWYYVVAHPCPSSA